jgi:predicted nucleic acid-binding protein
VVLVDTNILLNVVHRVPPWWDWSLTQLRQQAQVHELLVSPVVYSELAPSFKEPAELDNLLGTMQLVLKDMPRAALFLAGHVHRRYRQAGGPRHSALPDFLIGAHAMVLGCGILTRDARRFRSYFPNVPLVTPT